MDILIIFFHGNMFKPQAGNESRLHNLVKQLSKKNTIFTLESGEYKNESTFFVDKRFFFNPFIIRNNRFGTFFANLNPSYIYKLYKIMNEKMPHVIHVSYPHGLLMAKIVKGLFRNSNSLLVYESHNVESKKLLSVAKKEKGANFLKNWVSYIYTSLMERTACKLSDLVITVSEIDKKDLAKLYSLSEEKIIVVPNSTKIIDLTRYNKLNSKQKLGISTDKLTLLFHGTYDHYPNKEAINLIKEQIAPSIKEYKDIEIVIAGKDVPHFENDNVTSLGFVDDLNELLTASDISIVPLLEGGGTRVKILDYFGAGLPTLSTKKGIEGIEAKNYEHAIIVDDTGDEFINALIYLIKNEDKREEIGKNAYNLAKEKYNWDVVGENLNNIYNDLIINKKG